MGKHKIRRNKTCQNCNAFVEHNYCPKCGQENSDSRHPFHHLFTHFIFDLIHYDNSFWRTTKHLFLSPARLSIEYMNGKRKKYVNPFTFYIFVSFIAFFVPTLLPSAPDYDDGEPDVRTEIKEDIKSSKKEKKELEVNLSSLDNEKTKEDISPSEKIDSWYKSKPEEKQILAPEGSIYKKILTIADNIEREDRTEKVIEFFVHNLPKTLFVYMPIFAFWLLLFHNKKKRYYFDSGVFTLHFFSMLLLSITICSIFTCIFSWLDWTFAIVFLWIAFTIYITFYFFRANRLFFGERRWVSNIKAFFLVIINSLFIQILLILYGIFVMFVVYS